MFKIIDFYGILLVVIGVLVALFMRSDIANAKETLEWKIAEFEPILPPQLEVVMRWRTENKDIDDYVSQVFSQGRELVLGEFRELHGIRFPRVSES